MTQLQIKSNLISIFHIKLTSRNIKINIKKYQNNKQMQKQNGGKGWKASKA